MFYVHFIISINRTKYMYVLNIKDLFKSKKSNSFEKQRIERAIKCKVHDVASCLDIV